MAESGPHSNCLCASMVVFHNCETFLLHQCDGEPEKIYLLARVVWIFSYITWMFGFESHLHADLVCCFSQMLGAEADESVRWKR